MNPTAELLCPEVRELVQEGRYSELREILHELPFADVADILAGLDPAEAALAFRFLQRDDAAEVFSYFPPAKQEELVQKLGDEGSLRIVEAMSPDDRVRVLDELPAEVAQKLIASLSPESRRVTQAILGYPAGTVGRLMTPDYIKVSPAWTCGQAIEHVRKTGRDAETINVLYVIDDQGRLIDDLRLRQVLLADPSAPIESLMNRSFYSLRADQPESEAVALMAKYDRTALPVVDTRGALVGIVTVDDVIDVAQQQATESIQKLGGMEALDEPYMRASHLEMFRKRGFWLSALFVGQTVTIIVLGSFQKQIESAGVLAVFMPLVISCGGNSGSQAATLVTRALALGEVSGRDWLAVIRRESLTALLLATTLGAMGMVCVEVFTRVLGRPHTDHPLLLGVTVASAVMGVVLWGTFLGSLLPLVLKRFRFDPATASSPMVATLMDASGTLIYLGLAVLFLTGTIIKL
ncbi:MAG: magnesium transporter [Phycisphaerae bacterium]|nr:magnesium transporter [Phycisphaerae bacterium]